MIFVVDVNLRYYLTFSNNIYELKLSQENTFIMLNFISFVSLDFRLKNKKYLNLTVVHKFPLTCDRRRWYQLRHVFRLIHNIIELEYSEKHTSIMLSDIMPIS